MRRWEWAAIAAVTAGAAVLRLASISHVSPDPFYDAAVRSMGLSFHNFFFGAFEPGGSVSIDKPPVDLWLQVLSVKLLGFSSTTLKLPEVLAGVASVPLLFAAVRRMWSPFAGIAAAVSMAVLPVEVITARSDTMDAVMMMMIVIALLLIVRAVESGSSVWLIAGAAAMGVAFNVKLLESLVALPGLAAFAFVGMPGTVRRRALALAAAGAVWVVVSLSWLTATLVVPAHERPYAIGSTNGSAWNAAFVFNGTDRLGGKSPEPQFSVYEAGHHYPEATQSERDHIPIVPPSPTRLLARIGPLSGQRLGLELLLGLLLGAPALLWGVLRPQEAAAELDAPAATVAGTPAPAPPPPPSPPSVGASDEPGSAASTRTVSPERPEAAAARAGATDAAIGPRMRRATAVGLGLWTLSGIVLFSEMARLHPRYVEGFTPAVAALLGIGASWVASPRGRLRMAVLTIGMLVTVYYGERLLYGTPVVWWVTLAAALGAIACAAVARLSGPPSRARALLAPAGVLVLTLVAANAIPLKADVTAIETHVTDAGYVGALPVEEQRLISNYVRAHNRGAHYELAAQSATAIGSLIVSDARPVLVLTSYGSRVFTPVATLQRLIAQGKVRYAFLNTSCGRRASSLNPACTAPVKWVRAHGTDVSLQAGLRRAGLLYLLPGASP